MNIKPLVDFILERHLVYTRKTAGKPKPWTQDPILQKYRFCNVYRELDTVTQWVAANWRDEYKGDKNIWFAMAVARLVNWPDTLQELTKVVFGTQRNRVDWKPEQFVKVMQERKARGEKVFSGAYIVSTNGRAMDKAEYLAEHVLTPLWAARENLYPVPYETLVDFHTRLCDYNGMGSFMAAQVVADLKYAGPYRYAAPDWWTFAASGPGSRRGLNRVIGRDYEAPWKEGEWRQMLGTLQGAVNKALSKKMETLHAQDLQNCLCEFDKYERTRLDQGRPRTLYQGV